MRFIWDVSRRGWEELLACQPVMVLTRRAFSAALVPSLALAQREGIDEQVVFSAGEGEYHTYRIPALLPTPAGALLAFCEGRRFGRGDSGAIDLVVKRSEDSGKTWSALQVVWRDGGNTCGNPCPVVDARTGRVVLPMTWNSGEDHGRELHRGTGKGTRKVFVANSDDDGESWSAPREVTSQAKSPDWWWYATGPGVAIQLRGGTHAGRLVVPANHTSERDGFAAHAILSDDGGESWTRSSVIAPACNESQVVELEDGRLMMSSRSQSFTNCGTHRVPLDLIQRRWRGDLVCAQARPTPGRSPGPGESDSVLLARHGRRRSAAVCESRAACLTRARGANPHDGPLESRRREDLACTATDSPRTGSILELGAPAGRRGGIALRGWQRRAL